MKQIGTKSNAGMHVYNSHDNEVVYLTSQYSRILCNTNKSMLQETMAYMAISPAFTRILSRQDALKVLWLFHSTRTYYPINSRGPSRLCNNLCQYSQTVYVE